jgi:hypothetical protein
MHKTALGPQKTFDFDADLRPYLKLGVFIAKVFQTL